MPPDRPGLSLSMPTPHFLSLASQEIKCVATNFPTEQMQELGYHVLVEGQKSYNGVAILSKFRPELISTALYGGSEDPVEPQARYIEAKIADYHICNLYLPNGNPVNSMKFEYKLRCAPQFT
jgi:exodeoxyribonuclease-3